MIGVTTLDELLSADPHNVVRLILPARTPDDPGPGEPISGNANANAGERFRSWLRMGILATDPESSLYVYEQHYSGEVLQRGIVALVGVGDPESAGILPHEDVMPGPVRDRRDLMAATEANLEPIFLVYEGGSNGSQTASLADKVAAEAPPLVTAVTPDGIRHRLWRLADPASHAAIMADLGGRTALIADGHHRYAAYLELQDLMRSRQPGGAGQPGMPWDYGLAFLVDADVYPPQVGAIHRVVPGLRPARAARLAAEASFTVRQLDGLSPGDAGPDGLGRALACLAQAGQGGTAFLLAGASGWWVATNPDPAAVAAAMPAGASPQWRGLDAAVLQRLLLRAWGIEDNERDVLVFHDPAEALQAAASSNGVTVIMNPVPFGLVREIAKNGERVPRKSTSFGPKPRSGLVLRGFSA